MNKIFVIEGTDGSGKQTQTQLIYDRLIKEKKDVQKFSFPNYDNLSSGPVREYLNGNISKNANDISAKAASLFFAVDRYITYKENIEKYYNDNKSIILFDRYTTSNMLHQGGKILKATNSYDKLEEYVSWLKSIEYDDLMLPIPTQVFFLHMNVDFTIKLMNERCIKQNVVKDIHETDSTHLEMAERSGLYIAKKYNWNIIECVKDNTLRSINDIHAEIYSKLINYLK